jgi:hypothetical protein
MQCTDQPATYTNVDDHGENRCPHNPHLGNDGAEWLVQCSFVDEPVRAYAGSATACHRKQKYI